MRSKVRVRVLGASRHPDFRDVIGLLEREADDSGSSPPELVVLLQDRPGVFREQEVAALRRRWPLAGFVAVAGSWCEGELRTGRPLAGVLRIYWHQLPAWWRRQVSLREEGLAPEWAMPGAEFSARAIQGARAGNGAILISTRDWETAEALGDTLHAAGFATCWAPPGREMGPQVVRGVVAGVWDGGQLNDREVVDLNNFVRTLSRESAPVVALLDFPRWDSRERAMAAGAAAVMGKPWLAGDLLTTIDDVGRRKQSVTMATAIARAA
jgi:hypothetical protein